MPRYSLAARSGCCDQQSVVGQAEATARKQIRAVAIVGKRPWLAHQPVDDVPILDRVLAATTQPRQAAPPASARTRPRRARRTGAPRPTRRSAGWSPSRCCRSTRIVLPDSTRTLIALACLQPTGRQRPQQRQLLRQPCTPTRVALREQLPQERLVRFPAGEVAAATQHQRLVQGPLELAMALLHVAVLVALARLEWPGPASRSASAAPDNAA